MQLQTIKLPDSARRTSYRLRQEFKSSMKDALGVLVRHLPHRGVNISLASSAI
ncbi:hypothetical protein SAMD00023353_4800380 [Rosellinia necatrix]|uniref:Uncharacterized protein n=1 Tax=Rosellinia necatrix TaxID=77044 RepID=A0A1S8A9L9_ROSNE|nr:hypothetical protein SAMD00023353_4800380 [Rosellinia necatrix]